MIATEPTVSHSPMPSRTFSGVHMGLPGTAPLIPYANGRAYANGPETITVAPVIKTAAPIVQTVAPAQVVQTAVRTLSPVVVRRDEGWRDWCLQEEAIRAEADALLRGELAQLREDMQSIKNVVTHLNADLRAEYKRHEQVEHDLSAVIQQLVARVTALESRPSAPQESEQAKQVRAIEAKGNIRVNLETGLVTILRQIGFVPRRTTEPPIAELLDEAAASGIFQDLAAVAQLFDYCHKITIEGHTRGGESDFWQKLANDRARVVGQALVDLGVPPSHIVTKGLPGKSGLNRVEVVIKLGL